MHKTYEDLLLLYMTRAISVEQLGELKTHLAECPQCRASLNEWRAIASAVKQKSLEREYTQLEGKPMNVQNPNHYAKRKFSIATALTVLLVLLIVGFLTFLNRQSLQTLQTPLTTNTPTPTLFSFGSETVDIVIAARPIENGAVIHAEDVILHSFNVSIVPLNALTDINAVIGHIARTNIACGEVVIQTLVVENARDVQQPQPEFNYNRHECLANALIDTNGGGIIPVSSVVVARNNIPAGSRIELEDITTVYYPDNLVPAIASYSLEDIAGRTALIDIYREEMILINSVYEPTPIPVMTMTPSRIPPTSVMTNTPLPTMSPTFTITPSATWTTTPSLTPQPTFTPTYTLSPTPSLTPTPTLNLTNAQPSTLCEVRSSSGQAINIRVEPSTSSNRIAFAEADQVLNVIEARIGAEGITWYRVRLQTLSGTGFDGWVRSDAVGATTQSIPCPTLTP